MHYELPEPLIPVFQRHFQAGTELARTVMIIDNGSNQPQAPPGFWARRKARKAIKHLEQCLTLLPEHWPALWTLGKVWQALGEHQEALTLFARAARVHPTQVDVLREASIAATDAGAPAEAVKYSALAVALQPHDAGLLCNHAINLMLNGDDAAAVPAIEQALRLAPDDGITQNAHRLVRAVAAGEQPRPTGQQLSGR